MNLKQDISIGDNLQRLRRSNKYSQAALAALLQEEGYPISRDIITKMETGKYHIRISVLKRLKELYGVSYEEFFLDENPDSSSK